MMSALRAATWRLRAWRATAVRAGVPGVRRGLPAEQQQRLSDMDHDQCTFMPPAPYPPPEPGPRKAEAVHDLPSRIDICRRFGAKAVTWAAV